MSAILLSEKAHTTVQQCFHQFETTVAYQQTHVSVSSSRGDRHICNTMGNCVAANGKEKTHESGTVPLEGSPAGYY